MLNPAHFGFSATEMSQLRTAPQGLETGLATLESYGRALAPADTCRLMVCHIHATLDLGLTEHARKLFAGLSALIDEHPELLSARFTRPDTDRGSVNATATFAWKPRTDGASGVAITA